MRAPRAVRPAGADELLAVLAARREAVTSLRARARLRQGMSCLWTREALVVQRPDAVRIDVLSPFGLALALGTEGERLWAYPPSQATRYEGPATPENVTRFLGAPVSVADVVDVLLGVPPARTAVGDPEVTVTRAGEHRLTLPLADGQQTIWFAGDTLTVLRAEEVRPGGTVLRVTFEDYRDGFPHGLTVEVEPGSAGARIAYDSIEPNVRLDASLFAPPPAARVLPLEAAPG
jgi:outer membrane lipoprotein-sorting protein